MNVRALCCRRLPSSELVARGVWHSSHLPGVCAGPGAHHLTAAGGLLVMFAAAGGRRAPARPAPVLAAVVLAAVALVCGSTASAAPATLPADTSPKVAHTVYVVSNQRSGTHMTMNAVRNRYQNTRACKSVAGLGNNKREGVR